MMAEVRTRRAEEKRYVIHRMPDPRGGTMVLVVIEDGVVLTEAGAPDIVCPLTHVQLHSDGYEYGYGGSGPADLALSILTDYLGEDPKAVVAYGKHGARWALCEACGGEGYLRDDVSAEGREVEACAACAGVGMVEPTPSRAWELHQDFKRVIAALDQEVSRHVITGEAIASWLAAHGTR